MLPLILKVFSYFLIGNGIFDLVLWNSKKVFDNVNKALNGVFQNDFRESTVMHGAVRIASGYTPCRETRFLALISYFIEWYYVFRRTKTVYDCIPVIAGMLPVIALLAYDTLTSY